MSFEKLDDTDRSVGRLYQSGAVGGTDMAIHRRSYHMTIWNKKRYRFSL